MSVLKSVCSLNARLKICTPLLTAPFIQGKFALPTVAYFEEYVPVKNVTLPGRKDVYEPDYLDKLKPEFPPLELLNLKMVGFDFVVLERLQKLIHGYLERLDIDVEDSYAVRAESLRVQRFAPQSNKSEAEFELKQYQRVLQLANVPSTKLSFLIELVQAATPPGVTCTFAYHTEAEEKMRFIPDLEIKKLQEQLDELGGPSKAALMKERQDSYRK